jgi:hypothetical protein
VGYQQGRDIWPICQAYWVNESEFRLVDQLYNIGEAIGAPNDTNPSIVYEQCLNNLIPGVQTSSINFQKQQGQIREWFLEGRSDKWLG